MVCYERDNAMSTREILPDQWVEFFQSFTSDHDGWLVSVGVKGRQPKRAKYITGKREVRELPLRGIAADLKDKEHTVTVTVGTSKDKLLRHAVQTVSHVRLTQTEDGIDSGVQIESVNGQMTTVRLSTLRAVERYVS
jgi:hypothetical protein